MRKLKALIESRAQSSAAKLALYWGRKPKVWTHQYIASMVAKVCGSIRRQKVNRDDDDSNVSELYWEALQKAGFKTLGCGHFSVVVGHPNMPGYAYKASLRKEDSGVAYAAYCRANAGTPHLPEILHIESFPSCTVIVMPKYSGYYDSDDIDESAWEAASDGLWGDNLGKWAGRSEKETAAAIREYFEGAAQLDLHRGNVMWDANNNLVITDPVSFTIR